VNDWEVVENLQPDSLLSYSRYIVMLNSHIDGCSISTEPDMFPQYGRHFSAYTVREMDTVTTVVEEAYDYFEKVWYKTPQQLRKPCWVVYYDESDSLALTLDGMIASYSKPLYKESGKFVGVISTDLSLTRLSKVITLTDSLLPYPDSYFIMTGEDGRYLLTPDSSLLFTQTIYSDANPETNADIFALGHEMTTGKKGNMSVKINGKPCLVSYQPVPDTNWSLALVCPDRSILLSYNRLGLVIAVLIIVGLLLTFLFCGISVRHAVFPLNKLTSRLQRFISGNYDEQIPRSSRHDVVARLQNSFSTMQESLSRHVNDIQQMNAEAEQRNEELARVSELAKEADRQKMLFIQNVSHQIRTPLNIIMGFAQVLSESKGLLPEEEAKSITDMMRHNALMLDRMVTMLFDSSARGTTEELYTNRNDEVSCNEIAQECVALTHELFPDLPIRFITDVSDDFCISTSHLYLMRSIRELLYNAGKYSDGKNISIRVTEMGSNVRFVVQDTGPGIDEEDACRLFDFFTKINDLSDGLGLGLALARRHICNLGGDMFFDLDYQDGCRFVIELPKE
jgi:signal transduction histidine kinase